MTVSVIERTAVEDRFGPHPTWCDPKMCVAEQRYTPDILSHRVHRAIVAQFTTHDVELPHLDIPVRLELEQAELPGDLWAPIATLHVSPMLHVQIDPEHAAALIRGLLVVRVAHENAERGAA